jgi:hypothetical protein
VRNRAEALAVVDALGLLPDIPLASAGSASELLSPSGAQPA